MRSKLDLSRHGKNFRRILLSSFQSFKKAIGLSHNISKFSAPQAFEKVTLVENLQQEENIIDKFKAFSQLEASDVMINRKDIISAPYNISFTQLKKLFVTEGHSRIPIFRSSLDDIEGFIHIKDVFKESLGKTSTTVKVKELIRDIIVVPESIKLSELLTKMKSNQIHIAIVLDEHAGTTGLITIEDIVEELIGDIKDEHDSSHHQSLFSQQGNCFTVDASAEIEDIEKVIGIKLVENVDDVEYDTIGGFIITYLSFIPQAGYKFTFASKLEFEILESNLRRIKQVRITII